MASRGVAPSQARGSLADLLRAWRERQMLTQEGLAGRCGLSVGTIRGLESGRIRRPRGASVRHLADALSLTEQDRALLVAAVRGDPAEPADEAGRRPGVAPAQLPADVAGFTGRDPALRVLDEVLLSTDGVSVAVLVLAGGAGVGKSALAVHWAHRCVDRFPDGQLFVDLRGVSSDAPLKPLDVLARLLDALGIPADRTPGEVERAASMYRSLLASKRMLLVLDNAASAGQVRPLLPGSGGSAVLVTSRYQLRGLIARDGAVGLTLDALSHHEAVSLLGRVLGADRAAEDPPAVAELAELCGRLPLALRIAAANLASRHRQPISDYVALLRGDDRLSALSVTEDPDSAVLGSFDLSYGNLPADAARMFRLLALVPGLDFAAEAAAAVADVDVDEAQRLLDLLAGAHLVEEHAFGRYTFHDLLRGYAAGRARRDEAASDRAAALRRLYEFYLSAVNAAARLLYPEKARLTIDWFSPPGQPSRWTAPADQGRDFGTQERASAWLAAAQPALVAAVTQAERSGLRPMAWLLADALRGYFWLTRSIVDWLAVGEAALAAAKAAGEAGAEVAAWLSLADAHQARGSYRQAAHLYQRTRHAARRAPHLQPLLLAALNNLGWLYLRRGQLPDAEDCYQQALQLNHQAGFVAGQAAQLSNLGSVYLAMGRLDQAADHCYQAHALHRQLDLPRSMQASVLRDLGVIRHHQGRLDDARAHLTQAHTLDQVVGDRAGETETLLQIAAVDRDSGQPSTDRAEAALAVACELHDRQLEALALNTLASIEARLGRHQQAVAHHRQAYEIARTAELKQPETEALLGLAAAVAGTGDHHQARTYLDQAITITRHCGFRLLAAQATALLDQLEDSKIRSVE